MIEPKRTSLLGEKAAQKFNNGCTVLNVWLLDTSSARRLASWMNLSRSSATSILESKKKKLKNVRDWCQWQNSQPSEKNTRSTRFVDGPETMRGMTSRGLGTWGCSVVHFKLCSSIDWVDPILKRAWLSSARSSGWLSRLNECFSSGFGKHLLLAYNGLDKPSP